MATLLRPSQICSMHRRGMTTRELAELTGVDEEEVILICETGAKKVDPTIEGRIRQHLSQHESDSRIGRESSSQMPWLAVAVFCAVIVTLVVLWCTK